MTGRSKEETAGVSLLGTDSLGWAVTDSSYHILRAKGKDLWGVRLFPAALDSEHYRIRFRGDLYNITFIDNVQYKNKSVRIRTERVKR